jgi:hypothetical protein
MRRLSWLLPVAFFLLNPGFACGPPEPQFNYGAADMRAAVEGVWSFTIMPEGAAAPVQVMVKVEQAATEPSPQARARGLTLVRAAYACGTRTLVKSASACLDLSQMPLIVSFVAGDDSFMSAPMSGTFLVYGTDFSRASSQLYLTLGGYQIEAQLGPDGELFNARVSPNGTHGTLTIAARA